MAVADIGGDVLAGADEAAQPLVTEAALIPLVAGLPDVAAARLPQTGDGLVGTAGAGAGPGGEIPAAARAARPSGVSADRC